MDDNKKILNEINKVKDQWQTDIKTVESMTIKTTKLHYHCLMLMQTLISAQNETVNRDIAKAANAFRTQTNKIVTEIEQERSKLRSFNHNTRAQLSGYDARAKRIEQIVTCWPQTAKECKKNMEHMRSRHIGLIFSAGVLSGVLIAALT